MIAGLSPVVIALAAVSPAHASYVLEQVGPRAVPYSFGTEFNKVNFGPSQFDLSAPMFAVPNPSSTGTGLALGCDAGDYAGFSAGSIALVYRGICNFNTKAAIAQAAGASGILIGNSTDAFGDAPIGSDFGIAVDIPTFSVDFSTLSELSSNDGTLMVRLAAGDVVPTVLPPLLEQIMPDGASYMFRTDFNTGTFGPTSYDVSGTVFAVLNGAGTDLAFGCEASDFSGFATGSIAFVSRGTCSFNAKTALAEAAGAIGILIGNTLLGDAVALGDSGIPVGIPAQSTSVELRNSLFPSARDGTLSVRLAAGGYGRTAGVPEPASWAMMIFGFGLVGGALRRRRAEPSANPARI
jgi:hypothetical protein